MRRILVILCAATYSLAASPRTTELGLEERKDFPANFRSGVLRSGLDCIYIKINKNFSFEYKFFGDCHGNGRVTRGRWQKAHDRILLSGIFLEGPSAEVAHCHADHGHENTAQETNLCIKNYRTRIKETYGHYPARFLLSGSIRFKDDNETALFTMETKLINPGPKKWMKGPINFVNLPMGVFYLLE